MDGQTDRHFIVPVGKFVLDLGAKAQPEASSNLIQNLNEVGTNEFLKQISLK